MLQKDAFTPGQSGDEEDTAEFRPQDHEVQVEIDATIARILAVYGTNEITSIFRDGGNQWSFPYIVGIARKHLDALSQEGELPSIYRMADLGPATSTLFPYFHDRMKKVGPAIHYTGVELQPKFVEYAQNQIDRVLKNQTSTSPAEAELIQANFRDTEQPKLAHLLGEMDLVTAVAASDGELSFYRHLQTLLSYAKDGGLVFSLDYYQGSVDLEQIDRIRSKFRFLPGMKSRVQDTTTLAKPALEYGQSQSNNFRELAKIFGAASADWIRETYNVTTIPRLMKLIRSDDFIDFDMTIGRPALKDIEEVAQAFPELIKYGRLNGGPYNPTLLSLPAIDEIRAFVDSKVAAEAVN